MSEIRYVVHLLFYNIKSVSNRFTSLEKAVAGTWLNETTGAVGNAEHYHVCCLHFMNTKKDVRLKADRATSRSGHANKKRLLYK